VRYFTFTKEPVEEEEEGGRKKKGD